jgi:hypothetical protein
MGTWGERNLFICTGRDCQQAWEITMVFASEDDDERFLTYFVSEVNGKVWRLRSMQYLLDCWLQKK